MNSTKWYLIAGFVVALAIFTPVVSRGAVSACPDITGGVPVGNQPTPDGNVDASDLSYISSRIGPEVPYDPLADLNGDGIVNQQDASVWAGYSGRTNFSCTAFAASLAAQAITPAALSITKTDGLTSAAPGATTTYTVTITNTGGTAASDVQVVDTVPGNYSNVTNISDSGVLSGSTVTWTGLTVPANGTKTLTYKGAIATSLAVGTTTLTNTATLGCSTAAACPFSGTATDATTVAVAPVVVGRPSLTLTKTATATGPVAPGDVLQYTVTVANVATATANALGVVLTDTLPDGFTYTVDGSQSMSFPMGDIVPGGTKTVSYSVTVRLAAVSGSYTNTATAKGSNTDTVNATATVGVLVPQVLGETVIAPTATPKPTVRVLAATGAGVVDGLMVLAAAALILAGLLTYRRVTVRTR